VLVQVDMLGRRLPVRLLEEARLRTGVPLETEVAAPQAVLGDGDHP
jgi:hypothetical protein